MATSHYFNQFSPAVINEQRLLEDLINETVKISGHDIFYIVKDDYDGIDEIFGEMAESKYERAYQMEMYIKNVEGYEGDQEFFSKFGLEVRDNSNFIVPRRAFERYVPSTVTIRPREGDLLYVPLMKKMFEIKFVEDESNFFSLGKRYAYFYELRTEAVRFDQGDFNTGIDEIDDIENKISYAVSITLDSDTGSGNYNIGELVYQGSNLSSATAKAQVKDWDLGNTKLELINVYGDFAISSNVIGSDSSTVYTVSVVDNIGDYVDFDDFENKIFETEANNFIDFTESNPFGMP